MSKLPHKLDDQALLDLIEGNEVTEPEIVYPNDVLHFIATFNIEPGNEKIKQFTLFNIYKVWSKDPISKTEFLEEMCSYFSVNQIGPSRAFCINQSAIKLTHSTYKYFSNNNIKLHSPRWIKHFENFLKFHSLTTGDYWIDRETLYQVYEKYATATGLSVTTHFMKKKTFFIYCKIFLKQKLTKYYTLYAISDNIKQFLKYDQLAEIEKKYAKEKEDKAKRSRTSKPKPEPKSED